MRDEESRAPGANGAESPASLTDADMTTVRVDRRSFFQRAVAAGSVVGLAALTAACPGGTDSDGQGDAGVPATDADEQPTDSDQQATDADEQPTDSDQSR